MIHMDEDVVVVNKPASIPVSGVLPELYCQKIVCRIIIVIIVSTTICIIYIYIYVYTLARTVA